MTYESPVELNLGVVLTENTGFSQWKSSGILHREISLYKQLGEKGISTTFFHCEGKQAFDDFLFLPYSELIPSDLELIKSNQIPGAWRGLEAAHSKGIPFILRCGYSWARFQERSGCTWFQRWRAYNHERRLARAADAVVVSNRDDYDFFIEKYNVKESSIRIHENWVDTGSFKAAVGCRQHGVLAVGRLVVQKNFSLLIKAMSHLRDVDLTIIGEGPLKDTLLAEAKESGVNLKILDFTDHKELVAHFQMARIFALSSKYEGLPKVLLEAMSCSLPVVACPTQGVVEVVEDGINGFLAPENPEGYAAVIKKALDAPLSLAERARKTIVEHYSLEQTVNKEFSLMKSLVS